MIIGFHGPAGSGKDECGKFLASHGWVNLSYASPIYDMLEAGGFGRPKTQEEKEAIIPWLGVSWRYLATTLGTEWGRDKVRNDIWIILAARHVARYAGQGRRFYVTDVRFEDEGKSVRDAGGRIVHLFGREDPNRPKEHRSEHGIEFRTGDIAVHNDMDGIHALHRKLEIALRAWL